MGRVILDTSVVIDAEREAVDLRQVTDSSDVSVAAITVAELIHGAELSDHRHRPSRVAFIERLLEVFKVDLYNLEVARVHGSILAHSTRAGRPRGGHDLLIAATAIATDRVLITSDAKGFEGIPTLQKSVVTRRKSRS
ncbi:MAG: PIN domain-containing protein [Actinomycetota bacterium]